MNVAMDTARYEGSILAGDNLGAGHCRCGGGAKTTSSLVFIECAIIVYMSIIFLYAAVPQRSARVHMPQTVWTTVGQRDRSQCPERRVLMHGR